MQTIEVPNVNIYPPCVCVVFQVRKTSGETTQTTSSIVVKNKVLLFRVTRR
jgi:hypothetical protein